MNVTTSLQVKRQISNRVQMLGHVRSIARKLIVDSCVVRQWKSRVSRKRQLTDHKIQYTESKRSKKEAFGMTAD